MSSDEETEFPNGNENEFSQSKRKNSSGSNDSDKEIPKDGQKNNNTLKRHIACSLCRKRKLKCDGQRPKCSTCTKQNHICEYTETFRKAGPRRGYVKTLEQRVSQLETMLADAANRKPTIPKVTAESAMLDDDDDPSATVNFPIGNVAIGSAGHGVGGKVSFGFGVPVDPLEDGNCTTANHGTAAEPMNFLKNAENEENDPFSSNLYLNNMQVSGLNMDEPLPPDDMVNELLELFFNGLNRMIPMVDRGRFMAKMSLGFAQRPKLFLLYSIFLMASCTSDKYTSLSPLFYKRACKYMRKAETSTHFKDVANVQYVQASILLSTFEYRNALFPQAWLSVGSTMRACHMLNMHVVDVETYNDKNDEVVESDSALTDEIRRTFWVAVVCDRTASSGTGWPCVARTEDIFTKIPLEDEVALGEKAHLVTYESIFRNPEILARYKGSRLMIYILYSECQYEIAKLIMFPRKEHDLSPTGSWMNQYQRIDNLLSSLIFVLESVPPSDQSADRDLIINVHLMVHTAILCLNKCALLGIQNSPDLLRQFKREELLQRCANAATEITLLIRMSRDISSISSHPILTFVIYTCARFFLTAVQSGAAEFIRFKSHLDFLITTLRIMRVYMPMAQMFCDSIVAAAGEMFKGKPVPPEFNSKLPPGCLWPEPDIKPDTLRREEEIVFDTPNSTTSSSMKINSLSSSGTIPSSISPGSQTGPPTGPPSTGPPSTGLPSLKSTSPSQSLPSAPINDYNNIYFQDSYRYPANSSYPIQTNNSASDVKANITTEDINHQMNNHPTVSTDGGSSTSFSSGLTPLTGTPDTTLLPLPQSHQHQQHQQHQQQQQPQQPQQLPQQQPQQQPQQSFSVNLDWSSLMTTEAMWSEILGSNDPPIRNL